MNFYEKNKKKNEDYEERLELVCERLTGIVANPEIQSPFDGYFAEVAAFVLELKALADEIAKDVNYAKGENGKRLNRELYYARLQGDCYDNSFLNPTYAVQVLGEELGAALSAVYELVRSEIWHVYANDISGLCMKAELLVELYVMLLDEDSTPAQVKEVISSFKHDSVEFDIERRYGQLFDVTEDFDTELLLNSDFSDSNFLYQYGQPIGENEIKSFEYLMTFPQEELQAMADTYTEGFRIGFITCGKDITLKDFCTLNYPIGFEPMMRLAAENFRKMGIRSVAQPFSTEVNKQYKYDHEKDMALWLDKSYVERNKEFTQSVLESFKAVCPKYAGPAVVECFGETPFEPESRAANLKYDKKQQELYVQMQGERMQLLNEYIHGDERSFTIISYPIPEIGEKYQEIFAETVKLNTLDYVTYQTIQQKIIDILDTADYVHILGSGDNRTDLKVKIYPLANPEKETAFENCVADVNIPVGEVFTSPVLKGTNGKLHVTQVYLEGRNYLNLEIDFKDGMISDYTCTNFDSVEESRRFVQDNVLFNHETLPLGEFAIGTNTTAYRMGIDYDIQAKLPILIAEKTGPHFAVGDTCYSYDEDNETFNPDGKAIVARENSVSALRKENPAKAYFNCHTDITIPYNELKSIIAVAKDGTQTPVILDGRFVVPGTEELNVPLEGLF